MKLTTIHQTSPDWQAWAAQIGAIDWKAGAYLAKRMTTTTFEPWECVIIATDHDKFVGCCAVLSKDIVEDVYFTPYISTVYVDPAYRGKHISYQLVLQGEEEIKHTDYRSAYIVTEHVGLYEGIGYSEFDRKTDIFGREMRLMSHPIPGRELTVEEMNRLTPK